MCRRYVLSLFELEHKILILSSHTGTGAKPAFEYLYPLRVKHSSGRKVPSKTTPEDLLLDLLEIVRTYHIYTFDRHQYQHQQQQHQKQQHIPQVKNQSTKVSER